MSYQNYIYIYYYQNLNENIAIRFLLWVIHALLDALIDMSRLTTTSLYNQKVLNLMFFLLQLDLKLELLFISKKTKIANVSDVVPPSSISLTSLTLLSKIFFILLHVQLLKSYSSYKILTHHKSLFFLSLVLLHLLFHACHLNFLEFIMRVVTQYESFADYCYTSSYSLLIQFGHS